MFRQLIGMGLQAVQELRDKNHKTYKYEKTYPCTTPRITIHPQVMEWLKAPHLLIAGATGSGKSVMLNLFIHDLLSEPPGKVAFILIDPKMVELCMYRDLPHTVYYADTRDKITYALRAAIKIMTDRYTEMQQAGLRKYDGGDLYVIIDEYADLIVTDKKTVEPMILRIAQLGRAAKVHLIIATQRPTRDIITGAVKVNIDNRFALHCPTAQDSRNIIGQNGAETLAPYGEALYYSPRGIELYDIPMISEDEIDRVIDHWTMYSTGTNEPKQIRPLLPRFKH